MITTSGQSIKSFVFLQLFEWRRRMMVALRIFLTSPSTILPFDYAPMSVNLTFVYNCPLKSRIKYPLPQNAL
ncbi:hypothetical protein NC651_024556 [Populus alba x Populus x berolinensis]|nr:hypothetical protein NC651_024556 [Populus alba x Populus x berolinensis]